MSVKEAVELISYGTAYEIRGSYSGKLYHRSYANSSKNLDKYADREVITGPFSTHLVMRGSRNEWCSPVIVIRMYDHDLVQSKETKE